MRRACESSVEGLFDGYSELICAIPNSYSQTSFTATNIAGAVASFTFNGTGVQIFGAKRGNHGEYQIKVDDSLFPPVSGKATDPGLFQQPLFSTTGLNQGLHLVTLTNQENAFVDIDFVRLRWSKMRMLIPYFI